MRELREIVARLLSGEGPSVLATLVSVEGSSYRRPGARLLLSPDGKRLGSISGGCLEEDLVERCLRVRASGKSEVVVYDTTKDNDQVWGVGMGCHGIVHILVEPLAGCPDWAAALAENFTSGRETPIEVRWAVKQNDLGTRLAASGAGEGGAGIFLERVAPPTSLTIFGAGDDAQPLARIAVELGWNVTIADPRPALATEARFPGSARLVLGPASELVGRSGVSQDGIVVVMTHHYLHDLPIMRQLLPMPLAYLGLLGPKRRADQMLCELEEGGLRIPQETAERLRAPVGLDLGSNTPEEVALSIVAEIRSVLSGRDARPLRDRVLPIHG